MESKSLNSVITAILFVILCVSVAVLGLLMSGSEWEPLGLIFFIVGIIYGTIEMQNVLQSCTHKDDNGTPIPPQAQAEPQPVVVVEAPAPAPEPIVADIPEVFPESDTTESSGVASVLGAIEETRPASVVEVITPDTTPTETETETETALVEETPVEAETVEDVIEIVPDGIIEAEAEPSTEASESFRSRRRRFRKF